MTEIPVSELYELYLDTIGRCTSDLRNRTDEDINYDLFEEFDVGAWSFLHDDSLERLSRAGFIDDEMLAASKQLRQRWLALPNQSWTIKEIKTRKEWQELFDLCDRLKWKSRRPA